MNHRSLNYTWAGALSKPFGALRGETTMKEKRDTQPIFKRGLPSGHPV